MSDFVRVKNTATGHEYSIREPRAGETVIDKRAVDGYGRPLPARVKTTVTASVSARKPDSPADSSTTGDESADAPKEGSKK